VKGASILQQFINSWASGLIVAVIIATIIELILPENTNKKYVKMVSGIFIFWQNKLYNRRYYYCNY